MKNSYDSKSMTRFVAPLATVTILMLSSAMVFETVLEAIRAALV